ncbi:ABC transporter ATP-binding protein [Couchioplanes caeruleus]|uniref:ABC transporter n=2 Tax=Couchioplanes caeruleus TaxID=56438 RepID=A0A1K0GR38_9ACTN|nr:ABC transporter ATP-binding protein [Couchioplanes caeruleus]OJF14870.1 ABC transporter [Couchioplanes caeruleus subsp. caeruleus]ROP32166.1 putative ABC transport system ATP-binding protein [Couchioplanes caeruleus]
MISTSGTLPLAELARPALEVRALTRTYGLGTGAVRALANVSLAITPGSFTAVMGPSGSGKSTLLSCAAGLERPDGGRVLIAGEDITDWGEDQRARFRRERIGFIYQGFHLMPYLTATQNVGLPLTLAGRRVDHDQVRALLTRVGLADRARALPAVLSGGQRQRVAVARALITEPAVILADEPTGALDSVNAHEVLRLLRDCVDELDRTAVMVTHDPVAAAAADRVVFLVDGQVAGAMDRPTADAVAGQMAHLDELVVAS